MTSTAITPIRISASEVVPAAEPPPVVVAKVGDPSATSAGDDPTDTIGASKERLYAAKVSFGAALVIFFGTAIGECIVLWTANSVQWWRSIPFATSALFGLALLRMAAVLSVPLDMKWRIDLENAKTAAKRAEGGGTDAVLKLALAIAKAMKPPAE